MITVEKQHYAHGATLFTWVVRGIPELENEDYATRASAFRAVEELSGEMTWTWSKVFAAPFDGSTYTTSQYIGTPIDTSNSIL